MSAARNRTEKVSVFLYLSFSRCRLAICREQPWKAINLACVSRRDASARPARMLSRVFAKRSKDHRRRGCTVEVALGGTLFIVERTSAIYIPWPASMTMICGWRSWSILNIVKTVSRRKLYGRCRILRDDLKIIHLPQGSAKGFIWV